MKTYLIFYDISNNKLRTKLVKKLKAAGLLRIQKSVFMGTTLPKKITEILTYGKKNITSENDSLIVLPLHVPNIKQTIFLNTAIDMEIILAKKLVLFI